MTTTITNFSELSLSPPVLQAVQDVGYEAPSPIQAAAIPPLLAKSDLIGQAQTGTGKTAAFALPLLSNIDLNERSPQVLVLTPTRELAIQVAEAFQRYARNLKNFHVLPVYGGQAMGQQLHPLRRGVHIVVGTPGRIADHLRRGSLVLSGLKTLVLDEADEMLRMGFIEEVEWIINHTPKERQVALFSATMPREVRKVADNYLKNPVEIKIKSKTATVGAIKQRYWLVSGVNKLDALTRILEVETFDGIIIFVRTKSATEELAEKLEARGYAAAALNGDMNQAQREKNVERLKSGDLDIIIATDVAARGLDVSRISHVINFDIPYDSEVYVHRIGRTGRAGRTGEAILFVAPRERRMLRTIERSIRQDIEPMGLPSRAEVSGRRIERFKEQVNEVLANENLDFFRQLMDAFQHESELDLIEISAALALLAQRDRPLQLPEAPRRQRRDEFEERSHRSNDRGDRGDRGRRNERGDRGERSDRPRRNDDVNWMTYRLEVGREDGVEPKHIVGAIANEAEMESRYIGRIKLFDEFSTIELPAGIPEDIFKHLKKVRVCGKMLNIAESNGQEGGNSHSRSENSDDKKQPYKSKKPYKAKKKQYRD